MIQWLQTWSGPLPESFFRGLSLLGQPQFYLAVVPLLYWHWNRQQAWRLGLLLAASLWLNILLKDLLMLPRPSPLEVRILWSAEGSGWPSGHAQGAASFWFYLAWQLRRRWLYWVAGVVVLLVSLSRLYLGVHYPLDVVSGALFGLAMVSIAMLVYRYGHLLPKLQGWWLAPALALAAVTLHPVSDSFKVAGAVWGMGWGHRLHDLGRTLRLTATPGKKLALVTGGLIVLALLFIVLEWLQPEGSWWSLFTFGLLAFFTFGPLTWLVGSRVQESGIRSQE